MKGFVGGGPLRLECRVSRKGRTHAGKYSKSHSHESRKGRNRQGRRFGHHCSSCSNDRAASLCSRRHHHRRRHRGATAHKAAAQCGGTPCGRREKDDHRRQRRKAETGISASRSEEHTSELQSLMRISYAVFCLKKKKPT